MSLKHGTRIRIKHAMELGLNPSAYAFEAYQGAYYFIDRKSPLEACYSVCPESELDGTHDRVRPFHERQKRHLTIPEHCFVVEPEVKRGTQSQRNRLEGALKGFLPEDFNLDQILDLLRVVHGLDIERVMVLLELSHKNERMRKL